jgi:hypothetical protein
MITAVPVRLLHMLGLVLLPEPLVTLYDRVLEPDRRSRRRSRLGCGPARSHGTSEVRTARSYQATTAPTTASVDGYITNRF